MILSEPELRRILGRYICGKIAVTQCITEIRAAEEQAEKSLEEKLEKVSEDASERQG